MRRYSSASVWPPSRHTSGPLSPYTSDWLSPDATTTYAGVRSTWSEVRHCRRNPRTRSILSGSEGLNYSELDKTGSDAWYPSQGVAPRALRFPSVTLNMWLQENPIPELLANVLGNKSRWRGVSGPPQFGRRIRNLGDDIVY